VAKGRKCSVLATSRAENESLPALLGSSPDRNQQTQEGKFCSIRHSPFYLHKSVPYVAFSFNPPFNNVCNEVWF
jgi:hypothetical protein